MELFIDIDDALTLGFNVLTLTDASFLATALTEDDALTLTDDSETTYTAYIPPVDVPVVPRRAIRRRTTDFRF